LTSVIATGVLGPQGSCGAGMMSETEAAMRQLDGSESTERLVNAV